jgi:hypothetical protein
MIAQWPTVVKNFIHICDPSLWATNRKCVQDMFYRNKSSKYILRHPLRQPMSAHGNTRQKYRKFAEDIQKVGPPPLIA